MAAADDGKAAPLYTGDNVDRVGVFHASEAMNPSPLRRWKSAAVVAVLEKKCGQETV
jgi:hypothetical protein